MNTLSSSALDIEVSHLVQSAILQKHYGLAKLHDSKTKLQG